MADASSQNVQSLDFPLSLAATHIAVIDIGAYVNRSTATRRAQVAYGDRPKKWLNPFDLYLKAYRPRAADLAKTNSPQVLTTLVGKSWKMESADLRARYTAWGETEKANHYIAHPPAVPQGQ